MNVTASYFLKALVPNSPQEALSLTAEPSEHGRPPPALSRGGQARALVLCPLALCGHLGLNVMEIRDLRGLASVHLCSQRRINVIVLMWRWACGSLQYKVYLAVFSIHR